VSRDRGVSTLARFAILSVTERERVYAREIKGEKE